MARRRKIRPARTGLHGERVSPWPWVGLGAMVSVGFLYGASALVAPWWAVLLLALGWVAGLVLCLRWWTPHPRRLVVVAGVAAAVWFAVLVSGARFLGWG